MAEPSTPAEGKAGAVAHIFSGDPWERFDKWSERAWESAQNATVMAATIGEAMSPEGNLDPRIITSFHAAGVAKEFAEMTNPVTVVNDKNGGGFETLDPTETLLDMLVEPED